MIAQAVYILCALTSASCTVLLWRAYFRSKAPLLFWSGLAFLAFTATNIGLYVDLILLPRYDLSLYRTGATFAGVVILLYGLIKTSE